jgi:hypothetical protein
MKVRGQVTANFDARSAYRAIHWQALLVVVALPPQSCAIHLRFYSGNDSEDLYFHVGPPAIGVYGALESPALDFSNIIKVRVSERLRRHPASCPIIAKRHVAHVGSVRNGRCSHVSKLPTCDRLE